MKRYVVLYGARGVSREFKNRLDAEIWAKTKANQRNERVEINHLEGGSRNYSQGHTGYVSPSVHKRKVVAKKRVARRQSGMMSMPFGFPRMRF